MAIQFDPHKKVIFTAEIEFTLPKRNLYVNFIPIKNKFKCPYCGTLFKFWNNTAYYCPMCGAKAKEEK